MTMVETAELIIGVAVGIFALLFGLAKVANYVLRGFHNEHVQPVFAGISAAIEKNTTATTTLTEALAKTDELQRSEHNRTQATFDRMGEIIEDHETRITVLEVPPPPPAAAARIRPRRVG